MRDIIRKSFYKNGYLLIIAAWLYTISFIFSNYSYYLTSPQRVQRKLENYLRNSENDFNKFTADSALFKSIIANGHAPESALRYVNNNLFFFVYTRNPTGELQLRYWNNHKLLPKPEDLQHSDGKFFSIYHIGEFEFIKRTLYLDGRIITTAAAIPIHYSYSLKNNYLKDQFPAIDNIEKKYSVVEGKALFYIKNGDGKTLFGIKEIKHDDNYSSPGWVSLTLRIIAIIFVSFFINMLAYDVVQRKGWVRGLLLLACIVFVLRLLSYLLPFPFAYHRLELFQPLLYGSNAIHPSLGDLLVNMLLLFWLVSFFKTVSVNYFKQISKIRGRIGWVITAILSVLLVAIAFLLAGVIKSLIVDSKISFDVVNFFSLNIYTVLSFLILCVITLTFFYLSHFILLLFNKVVDVPQFIRYLFIAIAGLVYLTLSIKDAGATGNLLVLAWLLVYLLILEYRKADIYISIIKSSFFLIWLIFFAASISALIIFQNEKKDYEHRQYQAESIAQELDPLTESSKWYSVTQGLTDSFYYNNLSQLYAAASNRNFKDSLLNENYSILFDKYEVKFYTYNRHNQPLFNEDSTALESLTNNVFLKSRNTPVPNVYYYIADKGFTFSYKKEIEDSAKNILATFIAIATPREDPEEALNTELFQASKTYNDIERNYPYAVYQNRQFVRSIGDYDFYSFVPREDVPRQEFVTKKVDDHEELWYNAGNNKLIILVKTKTIFLQSITLFAYLFGSFLFIVVLYQVTTYLIRTRFRWTQIKRGILLNIRTQVQGTIIFISVFSFLVIGVATISFYIKRFNQTNRERLINAIKIIATEVEKQIERQAKFDDVIKIYDPEASPEVIDNIKEISATHNVDVNFYSPAGYLKISTQPYIYDKELLSNIMEPRAYYELNYGHKIQLLQDEQVGRITYTSVYIPVKNKDGELYGYLNIPYLKTQKELNQEISNFLVTLINLNAFIFVIAGIIALLLTNRITSSFTLIGNKMKQINLGQANEEISWNTNDEIGSLVNEYNKMVKKLEESAQALAKSEREGAWREMARQVAHEIKNPLTPMKLSIQYLQRSIQEKKPDMQELSKRVAATLIEQIDQLAKIASDFSQFANIGNLKVEEFDVNEVIDSLVNLYRTNEKLSITWHNSTSSAIINADRSQINRLFTNLLQNAIEASTDKNIIPIKIAEEVNANKLLISVTDEGTGIPEEKKDKIFTPNFTTKTSGTGLGLAMCKGIAEKANGRIWFETKEGEGTTFFVLLPLTGLPD